MASGELRSRTLDIVTACRSADLPILSVAAEGLKNLVPFRQLHVITMKKSFSRFRRALGKEVELIDQDTLIEGMTLRQMKQLLLPGFPRGAGWYFQQLLKLAFCLRDFEDEYFLIWDADTVPLRPLEFFDERDRILFTIADEYHQPYFDNYYKLLGERPQREFSFISQHMIAKKSIVREMLRRIDSNFPGSESWAWKIMQHLEGFSTNLFSEYETLGHFVKTHYPLEATYRKLPWLREGALETKGLPSRRELKRLAQNYYFAAFESRQMPLRNSVRRMRRWLGIGNDRS